MAKKNVLLKRTEALVDSKGLATLRFSAFLAFLSNRMDNISLITTEDATDLASVLDLANDTKAKINELINELIAAKAMSES